MTSEEYQWGVNLVQDRYHDLNLTFEQAEQIYKYELDKSTYSEKHSLSDWEEWDYELTTFKQILNDVQLREYESYLKKNVSRYEQNLIESDTHNSSNGINYYEELINFYETRFLPDLSKDLYLSHFDLLNADRTKIDFLKAEYKKFLNDRKKEILSSHFRHYRTFKPNELKLSLLRHRLLYVFPNYLYFEHEMDEPTKAVAQYLKSKYRHFPERTEELLTKKFEELKEFSNDRFKKHYGETKGWHVVIGKTTDVDEKEYRTMTLLLLDKEKYGINGV